MGRARCESYKSIDVRRWQRQGLLSPGTFFSQTWTRDGEPSGNIGVLVKDGSVTLGYRLGQNGQPIEQPVYFSWTRPQFGGRRPWFLCPLCIRRVTLLYLRGERWACRICCDLAYRSELQSKGCRGQMKARKIRARLGGDCRASNFQTSHEACTGRRTSAGVKSMTLPSRSHGAAFGGRGSRSGSASVSLHAAQVTRSASLSMTLNRSRGRLHEPGIDQAGHTSISSYRLSL
jgi:hypothetical protein